MDKNADYQYCNLIDTIINKGEFEEGRNGRTLSYFGMSMRFDLSEGKIPLLTTKKLAWKTCLKELLWFISGKTDNKILKDQNVHIWDDNASREFLDSRGLYNREVDDLGPVYGHQWRHFNAKYDTCVTDYFKLDKDIGVDQLENIIHLLKNLETRNSRRIILSAWNPQQLDEMALPPCHILAQFNVSQGKYLSCSLYQRSGDVGLGVPFNIASYSFLTHLLAHHCGLEPKEFVHFIGNAHIYDDHIESLKQQITRIPYDSPKLTIKNKYDNINDYKLDDFEVVDYKFHDLIKMKMRT
jgi:thymidylate synthase